MISKAMDRLKIFESQKNYKQKSKLNVKLGKIFMANIANKRSRFLIYEVLLHYNKEKAGISKRIMSKIYK